MSEPTDDPKPAVAVSPTDQSPDRPQSDADQAVNVGRNTDDRAVSDAADARAIAERKAARVQADVNQGITNQRIDELLESNERATQAAHELIGSNQAQTAAADRYSASMRELQERSRQARRRFRITLVLILLGFTGLYIRQEVANQASQDARHTIIDCVTPAGKCFKDGQARTAELVGTLNKVTALAAACAPSYVGLPLPDRIVAIEHCIKRGLK